MRGLACVLMFQTHCYDSWMSPEAKKSPSLIGWSRLGGTLPAPLFIFLAGVSFALVTEKLREKGVARNAIAKQTILRGAEIFGMGLLFRMQEFSLGYPWSPWTDLLRIDVLNILGLSMMLMGVLCWLTSRSDVTVKATSTGAQHAAPLQAQTFAVRYSRNLGIFGGVFAAVIVAMATPPLWTTHRPKFLPWPIESYINGVHIFDQPQPWLFPLFPWSAFAWGLAQKGFSPIIQLGNTSLLVYWVHIEFVYGRFSILPKGQCSALKATAGLITIFLAMLGLSLARTTWKKWRVRASQQSLAATAANGGS